MYRRYEKVTRYLATKPLDPPVKTLRLIVTHGFGVLTCIRTLFPKLHPKTQPGYCSLTQFHFGVDHRHRVDDYGRLMDPSDDLVWYTGQFFNESLKYWQLDEDF